jgi:MFS family permease
MWPELKEGVRFVLGHRHLKWIAVCTGTSNFFGQAAFAIGILYMQRSLHMSSLAVGVVFAGFGVGAIIGALGTARFQQLVGGIGRAIVATSLLFSAATFAFPLAPRHGAVVVLLVGTFVFGFSGMAYNITQVSYRQAITPERMQGRMNATMRWIVWGTIPLGALLGGVLGEWWSLRGALWVGAIGGATSFLPVLLTSVRSIKEMPKPVDEPLPMQADAAGGLVEPTTSPLAGAAPADA